MTKNQFVFVVCGSKEHIDTLHFSLQCLKRFSKNTILVLTDSLRNEISIQHEHIIDVQTPKEFNHHQASIFLKTGIHQFLPKENRYCYLDSDVIALSAEVDQIFDQYVSPITFAPDHCQMNQFSPFAVNCECQQLYENYNHKIEKKLKEIDPLRCSSDSTIIENRKKLVRFYQAQNSLLKRMFLGLRFVFTFKTFHLTEGIKFDKKQKFWKDENGIVFMNHFSWRKISKQAGLKWNRFKSFPQLPDQRSLWYMECNHLKEEIEKQFEIKINKPNFQHWNGGVFLFDYSSRDFLNEWHNSSLEIFKNSKWKTRDQGTLIKTVWQFGLQNHPTLNKKWNLIADFHNPFLEWEKEAIRVSSIELYEPVFVHVYHHFGDKNWEFWNTLIQKISS